MKTIDPKLYAFIHQCARRGDSVRDICDRLPVSRDLVERILGKARNSSEYMEANRIAARAKYRVNRKSTKPYAPRKDYGKEEYYCSMLLSAMQTTNE